MPTAWKLESPWRAGTPQDTAAKGEWWASFKEPALDSLISQALTGSPTIAAADARLAQAQAAVTAVSAGMFPQVGLGPRVSRGKISGNRPLTNYASPNFSTIQSDYVAAFSVNYEADVFGRVRRSVEGVRASAAQSAADAENVRLLLITELAVNYFTLRALDLEMDVLLRSIELQRRALGFVAA